MRRISRIQTAHGLKVSPKTPHSLAKSRLYHAATAPPTCAIGATNEARRNPWGPGVRPACIRQYSTPAQDLRDSVASSTEAEDAPRQIWGRTTKLKVPPKMQRALSPDEIDDASYVPATSGLGLEEIGGVKGYWEDDAHWNPEKEIETFAPRQKVWDAAVLEVLARRAVIEAIVVRNAPADLPNRAELTGSWTGWSETKKALALNLQIAEDGTASIDGKIGNLISRELASKRTERRALEAPLDANEARELLTTWDGSWKGIALQDTAFKFAVTKRVYQLTGHLIADVRLNSISTVRDLLAILIKPPKPKKLAEELGQRGQLDALSNVTVYDRRVTPIDKHKMVGRWKVIVEELEKRELPATGTGGHGRTVEKRWLDPRPHSQRGKLMP